MRATPIRLCEREAQAGSIALPRVEQIAHVLLRRYGVVFRKLLDREEGLPGNRVLFEDGVPIAIHSGSETHYLKSLAPADEWEVRTLMIRRLQAGGFVDQTTRAQ